MKVEDKIKKEDTDKDIDTEMSRDTSRDIMSQLKTYSGTAYELPPEATPNYQHNEQRRLIISALSSVCREAFSIGDENQERAADALVELGATEDDIIAFGPYWDKKEDKPNYTGKPYLKSLMQNIKDSIAASKKVVATGLTDAQIAGRTQA